MGEKTKKEKGILEKSSDRYEVPKQECDVNNKQSQKPGGSDGRRFWKDNKPALQT